MYFYTSKGQRKVKFEKNQRKIETLPVVTIRSVCSNLFLSCPFYIFRGLFRIQWNIYDDFFLQTFVNDFHQSAPSNMLAWVLIKAPHLLGDFLKLFFFFISSNILRNI